MPVLERRGVLAGLAAFIASARMGAKAASAQSWQPSRPVRIVVPFAAGGPTDTVARILADGMTPYLGQPVYIDNIGGEGGQAGVLKFLNEAADGHVLLMGHMGTHGAAPALNGNLGYDPVTDFEPIGLGAGTPVVICASKALDVRDMAALRTYLASRARDIRMAHAGRGSVSHAGALLLNHTLKAQPTLVGYEGTGPALNDLISGDIALMVDQIVNVAPAIMSRRIVPLAITTQKHSLLLPGVPSVAELGLDALRMDAWNGLFAKAGTSSEQIETLNSALRAAHRSSATRARLMDLGAVVPDDEESSPPALLERVRDETRRWSATLYELRNDQALR